MTGERERAAFVRANAALASPPLVPEIALWLAAEAMPLWSATEAWLARADVAPPYWAFAWAGGQALARWVLDTPGEVRGRVVVDAACGGGIAAIAAARAGAARVIALDVDPLATVAARLNAEANGVAGRVTIETGDATAWRGEADVVLAGDVCYERPMAEAFFGFLRARAAGGARVLLGDPDRTYAPRAGVTELARWDVPTPEELEGAPARVARVLLVT